MTSNSSRLWFHQLMSLSHTHTSFSLRGWWSFHQWHLLSMGGVDIHLFPINQNLYMLWYLQTKQIHGHCVSQSLRTFKQSHRTLWRLLFQNCAKANPAKALNVQSVAEHRAGNKNVWKAGTEQKLPWETDETWCSCACRRLLCVPLGMQFTALPMQSATSTLATVLPDMLRKTLDRCRVRLQVLPVPKFISPGDAARYVPGGFFFLSCAALRPSPRSELLRSLPPHCAG